MNFVGGFIKSIEASRIFLFFVLLLTPIFSFAALTCGGKVSGVSINGASTVFATVKGSGTNLKDVSFCNMRVKKDEVYAESCDAIYSLLLSASVTGNAMVSKRETGRVCYGLG